MINIKSCVEACLACLVECESCITYCTNNGNKEHMALCRDCADICLLCARLEARDSIYIKELHALCAEICHTCSVECAKHASQHASCKECAKACRRCAEVCGELVLARTFSKMEFCNDRTTVPRLNSDYLLFINRTNLTPRIKEIQD